MTPLTWLHIGDLHLKEADGQNVRDLDRIVAAIKALPPGSVDFVLLPGDNADDGTPEQYAMLRERLASIGLPVHVLTGDHDIASGDLEAFYKTLGVRALPYASTVRGCRCLFIDVVSAGSGGPDFRLDGAQLVWAESEANAAAAKGEDVAVFMHTYPADLRAGAARIGSLLAAPHVTTVDMGHTHYNELANDGGTIFMATRSTGQIEEGPAGFSIATIDSGCVGWRFKALDALWPFVLITSPADRRLATQRSRDADRTRIRARVIGDAPIVSVTVQADGAAPLPMTESAEAAGLWEATIEGPAQTLVVTARDQNGREDQDRIEPEAPDAKPRKAVGDGSDKDRIEPWPEKGIPGGQLGPNRNGRKW